MCIYSECMRESKEAEDMLLRCNISPCNGFALLLLHSFGKLSRDYCGFASFILSANIMPSTRMTLKRHTPDSLPALVSSHTPEQNPPVEPAPASPSSEGSSDDDVLAHSEGNPDAFSDDCVSSDGDVSSSRPRRSTVDTKAISVVSEPLKRDHRWLPTH